MSDLPRASAASRLRVRLFAVIVFVNSGVASGVLAQATPGRADIDITVRTPNAVRVEEQYVLDSAAAMEWRVLTRPCVVIERFEIERNGRRSRPDESRSGRWISWRDSTSSSGDSTRIVVRYDAWLGGSGAVPLVHLAGPLTNTAARRGAVSVTVRFPGDSGRVDFPHMTRQALNEWTGRFVAIPSFVKVREPNPGCDALSRAPGDHGGLVWRFSLLIGIMVTWVPVYLAWARRSSDRA